jgi:hypothetical protein
MDLFIGVVNMMTYEGSGSSGIASYEIDDNREDVTVVFHGGGSYQYSSKALAEALESGSGANTYINRNLK